MTDQNGPPRSFEKAVERLERVTHLLAYVCLGLLILYPILPGVFGGLDGLLSIFGNRSDGQPLSTDSILEQMAKGQHSFSLLFYWLQHEDAGGDMGLGPWVLRALALAAVALPGIFPALEFTLPRRLTLPLIGFLGLSFLSAFLSSHPYEAVIAALDTLLVCGVGLRTSQLLDHSTVSAWLSLLPVIVLCHLPGLFFQFCFRPAVDGQMRGAFHHPNMMASYLLMVTPIVLLRALQPEAASSPKQPVRGLWSHWRSSAYWILVGGMMAAVVLSGSRAALFGLSFIFSACVFLATAIWVSDYSTLRLVKTAGQAFGLALLCLGGWAFSTRIHSEVGAYFFIAIYLGVMLLKCLQVSWIRGPQLIASVVLAVALVMGAQSVFSGSNPKGANVLDRSSHAVREADNSFLARASFFMGAWQIFCDHPLLGVGPAGFHRYYPQYQVDARWFSKFPHDLPLAVLCENGLPAFGLLSLAGLTSLLLVLKYLVQDDAQTRLHRISALLGVLALQAVSLFDVQWQFPVFPLTMGFLLGCCWLPTRRACAPAAAQSLPASSSSPWALRPMIVANQTACAIFLGLQAVNLWAGEGEYYHEVSKLASSQQRYTEAAELSRYATFLNPWQGEFFHQLGLAMLSETNLSKEDKVFLLHVAKRSVSLDSHRAVHQDLLSKVLLLDKDLPGAEEASRGAMSFDSTNYPTFYLTLAQMHFQAGDAQGARLLLEGALNRFPAKLLDEVFDFRAEALRRQLSEVYTQLGEIADPQKHPRDSEPFFKQALVLDKESFQGHLGESVSLFEMGELEKAIPHLEFLRAHDPGFAAIHAMLSQCYQRVGKVQEAKEESDRFTELDKKK